MKTNSEQLAKGLAEVALGAEARNYIEHDTAADLEALKRAAIAYARLSDPAFLALKSAAISAATRLESRKKRTILEVQTLMMLRSAIAQAEVR